MDLTILYELFRLEVKAGQDLFHRDSNPALLDLAQKGNTAIKAFLAGKISWEFLLDFLEFLGVDPNQYQKDVASNFQDRGLPWFN